MIKVPYGPGGHRHLSDAGALMLAVGAGIGALVAVPMPIWPVLVASCALLVARRPVLLAVAVTALASGLAAQAVAGARPALEGTLTGRAVVLTDPAPVAGAVRAEIRMAGHHFDAWARGGAAATLRGVMAGEEIDVSGAVTPRREADDYALQRHIVGQLVVEHLARRGPGNVAWRTANAVRRILDRGADGLAPAQRALFAGFVLGDRRGALVTTEDDFRGAGLGHLLVVSGENVAFVLAASAPLVRRFGPRGRWAITVVVLALFATMTRFEPSVLRATVMAGLTITAWGLGRPVTGIRVLALCITGLLLADPLLVGVVGFRLSVAASLGILVLARPLADALPLPRWLGSILAVTLAAQLGVAPILVMLPGGMPVAAIPANVAAEPAAAAVMAWGLTAGLLAGLAGGPVATVLHGPTTALLWWVASVARWASHLGLGDLSLGVLAVAVAVGTAAVVAARRRRPRRAAALWLSVVLVVVVCPLWFESQGTPRSDIAGVGTLWRGQPLSGSGATVLVLTVGAKAADVLAGLRRARAGHLDVLVVPSGTRSAEALVAVIASRVRIDRIWVPASDRGQNETFVSLAAHGREVAHPKRGEEAQVGGLHLNVTAATPRLEVEITLDSETASEPGVGSARVPGARSPPL